MAKKPLSPTMKSILEYGPLAVIFIAFYMFKDQEISVMGQTYDGFIAATAVFVPVLVLFLNRHFFWHEVRLDLFLVLYFFCPIQAVD